MYNMAKQAVSVMASHARQISSLALMAIAQDGHLDMHGLDYVEFGLKVLKSQSDAEETRYAVLAMMVELHKQRQLPLELLLQHNAQEHLAMLLTTGVSCPYYIFCHVWQMPFLQLSSLYQKFSGACQPGRCSSQLPCLQQLLFAATLWNTTFTIHLIICIEEPACCVHMDAVVWKTSL